MTSKVAAVACASHHREMADSTPPTPAVPADAPDVALFSVRPRWGRLIMSGDKTVELRRTIPRRDLAGCLVYATSPVSAIVGSCRIVQVSELPLDELRVVGTTAGCVQPDEFDTYFRGRTVGGAIWLTAAEPLAAPIPSAAIAVSIPTWRPPQSFRYVNALERRELVKLGLSALPLIE